MECDSWADMSNLWNLFVQAWVGYYQSLRPCAEGLYLNVDTACTAFVESKVVSEIMLDFNPRGGRLDVNKLQKKLKNLKVGCTSDFGTLRVWFGEKSETYLGCALCVMWCIWSWNSFFCKKRLEHCGSMDGGLGCLPAA